MITREFNSLQDAYFNSLSELKKDGVLVSSVTDNSSVGSNFGNSKRDFIELQGFAFSILNPRKRIIWSESRRISLGFNFANLIWLFSGRKDIETISFYNKKGKAYSSDGLYYEAAFGDRLFGEYNLWEFAKKLLQNDITSRRALMPIFIPNDLISLPKDTPCASSIQVMIRDGKVDFFLHMRSQSVITVFPYDIFIFTMLHEYISLTLSLPMGKFNYYCNSFHYYIEEAEMLDKILKEEVQEPTVMDNMPKETVDYLPQIFEFEKTIRQNVAHKILMFDKDFDFLPNYWQEMCKLLYIKANKEFGNPNQQLNCKYLNDKKLYI